MDMKSRPKRRRAEDNPYIIYERNGKFYIAFKDNRKALHKFEIDKSLYEVFDSCELEDLKYLNYWDRHIEHSEIYEDMLNKRAFIKPRSMEDAVLKNMDLEKVKEAMNKLPEKQRRRLIYHYFEDMTYEQIAKKEGCSKMPVKRSIDAALHNLKKILKNF